MKRILLMVFRNIIYVPYMWIRLCYHAGHANKYTDEEHYSLFKFIVKRANKSGNLLVKKYGEENIPKEDGFIFFPNHQGMYDLLAIIDACDRPLSFVGKKEVSNVPCDIRGRMMVIKYGRFGKFLACPGYPECKNTKPFVETIDIPCPKCGGKIQVRKTKKRKNYYICENNPKSCDYISWNKPKKEDKKEE